MGPVKCVGVKAMKHSTGDRLSMVRFVNLLHWVRTCTEPKVQGASACLLMNPNLAAGSGSDNLQTCTGRFEPGCTHKHFVHLNC